MIEKTGNGIIYRDLKEYNINDVVVLKKLFSKRKMLFPYIFRADDLCDIDMERDYSDKVFVVIAKEAETSTQASYRYPAQKYDIETGTYMVVSNDRIVYELESTDLSLQLKNICSYYIKDF